MKRAKSLFQKREKGVAAVEFALILPVFLTILFAIMDFGWLFFQQQVLTSASREGARAGALADTDANAQTQAASSARAFATANGLDSNNLTISTSVGGTPKVITVRLQYRFDPLVGMPFLPSSADPYPSQLGATAIMRREN